MADDWAPVVGGSDDWAPVKAPKPAAAARPANPRFNYTPQPGAQEGDIARLGQAAIEGGYRAVGNTLGLPVDLATMAINSVPAIANLVIPNEMTGIPEFGNIVDPQRAVGGSAVTNQSISTLREAAGQKVLPEDQMTTPQKYVANTVDFAGQGLAGAGPFIREAIKRGGKAALESLPAVLRPYAETPGRAVAVDVAAGAGAGAADQTAENMAIENPIARMAMTLLGGLSGATALQAAVSPATLARTVSQRIMPDTEIPLDPASGLAFTQRVAQQAAEKLQGGAINREEAANTLRNEMADADGGPSPTSGNLSNDPGLIAMERGARASGAGPHFVQRDREVRQNVADRVGSLQPEDANPRAATDFLDQGVAQERSSARGRIEQAQRGLAETQAQAAQRIAAGEQQREAATVAAGAKVDQAKQGVQGAKAAEQAVGAPVQARGGQQTSASERLAAATAEAKASDEATKSGLYREAGRLGATVDVDAVPFAETARAIKDEIGPLAQGDMGAPVRNVLDDLERLATPADPAAGTMGEVKRLTAKDLIDMLPRLSRAQEWAFQNMRGDAGERLAQVRTLITQQLDGLAEQGNPAGVAWAKAKENFETNFAPKYRQGVGKDLDKAERAGRPVPPSAVAPKMLRAGAGGKEAAEDMQRILAGSNAEQAGKQAARDYVLADLASVVKADGSIDPNRLRAWRDQRTGMLGQLPDVAREVDELLRNVVARRGATTQMQADLAKAVAGERGTVASWRRKIAEIKANNKLSEKEKRAQLIDAEKGLADLESSIKSSALRLVLDSDPVVAVGKVFGSRDPERAMAEIVQRVGKDKDAAEGWKAAVSKYLQDELTGTNPGLTTEGSLPVSAAKVQQLLKKHEKTLSAVFDAKEMNTLRRAQKILEVVQRGSNQATVGSATVENRSAMRWIEIGLKSFYGGLSGGNKFRNLKLAMQAAGVDRTAADALIINAFLDPKIMAHLLDVPLNKSTLPGWNYRLATLIAAGSGARAPGWDEED